MLTEYLNNGKNKKHSTLLKLACKQTNKLILKGIIMSLQHHHQFLLSLPPFFVCFIVSFFS